MLYMVSDPEKVRFYVDTFDVDASAAAAGFVRRIIPATGNPYTNLAATPVDGSWRGLWIVHAMQLEIGNSASTDKQAVIVDFQNIATPKVSISLMHLYHTVLWGGSRCGWVPAHPLPSAGVTWEIRDGGLALNDQVRCKVLYEVVR